MRSTLAQRELRRELERFLVADDSAPERTETHAGRGSRAYLRSSRIRVRSPPRWTASRSFFSWQRGSAGPSPAG